MLTEFFFSFLFLKGIHELAIYGCIFVFAAIFNSLWSSTVFPCYKNHLLTLSMPKKMQTKCVHHFLSTFIFQRRCNFQTVQWVKKKDKEQIAHNTFPIFHNIVA